MRAALRKGLKTVECIEMDRPTPLANEVLIAIKACGICGSDIVRIQEDNPRWDEVVLGHEFAGEIVEVGADVEGWNVGDRASAAPLMPCMKCKACQQGNFSLCKGYSFIGSRVQGAFGEFLRVPAQNLVEIGDLSYAHAAFLEPITVCLHPILRLENLLGKDVVVTGAGTIGLLAVQIFKAMGCKNIVVSDVVDAKLDMAMELGATAVCNPIKKSLEDVCAEVIPEGADVVFESSGSTPAKISAIAVAKGRGSVLLVGTSHADVNFTAPQFELVSRKELNLVGSWMNYSAPFPGDEWPTAAWMIEAGLINVEPILTHSFGVEDIQKAYDVIYENKELWAKVMVTF